MTPYFADEHLTVYLGDCLEVMAALEPESVHCVVTSPPYWGLRDYGVPGQLGLEPTPEEYVANMVAVFHEVRRVLRKDGTVWLNLGDSYAGSGPSGASYQSETTKRRAAGDGTDGAFRVSKRLSERGLTYAEKQPVPPPGLKPKDLVGIPWRVAFALQADGWYLRSDIIWSKPNPMPESVTDRPTKAHEYLFLLSKSPRYYFDGESVRLPISPYNDGRVSVAPHDGSSGRVLSEGHRKNEWRQYEEIKGANIRTVWTIATQPYPGAHFATFPQKLVEPCIKAGTSEKGICPECGVPWERETSVDYDAQGRTTNGPRSVANRDITAGFARRLEKHTETTGWHPSCRHDGEPVPATVLDPFAGSGTTALVAQQLGRRAVLIDLSADYLGQVMVRNAQKPLGLVG